MKYLVNNLMNYLINYFQVETESIGPVGKLGETVTAAISQSLVKLQGELSRQSRYRDVID